MDYSDNRFKSAKYYELDPSHPNDFPFYKDRIHYPNTNVLELGCGNGRVLYPLTSCCDYIHGLDISETMLAYCQEKLDQHQIGPDKATIEYGDITNFSLGRTFDLIIAPFRVLQNLETREQIDGFFKCIKSHLGNDGKAIVNVRNPTWNRETIINNWCRNEDEFCWELETLEGTVKHYYRRPELQSDPLVLFPELVYRLYKDDEIIDETILKICQHCLFPDELIKLIESHGFLVTDTWGGYEYQAYGEGDMLIVEFTHKH